MSGNAAVDLRELAPAEMARLLGKPEGEAVKTLVGLHREAGFREVVVEHFEESITRADGTPWERRYSIVTARH
jgi:hypothetical protein